VSSRPLRPIPGAAGLPAGLDVQFTVSAHEVSQHEAFSVRRVDLSTDRLRVKHSEQVTIDIFPGEVIGHLEFVRFDGEDVTGLRDAALSRLRADRVGFVFQQFHLSSLMSVVDNVAEGLLYSGVRYRERQQRAATVLDRLGLGHRLNHRPQALSGGERQRVAIARAIVGDPEVVLADEPTGNLDTTNGQAVVEILRDLSQRGTAVVVITHDREVAAEMETRIIIRDGEIRHSVREAG
jgi:putative ABC transport system ATP-binding protein